MRDFSCCAVTLPTLHDLLQHYEEAHATKPTQPGHRPSQSDRAALAAAAIAQQQSQQQNNQSRGLQPDRFDMMRKPSLNLPQHSDLDTIDDMEMDEPMGENDTSQMFSQQQNNGQGGFGDPNDRGSQLNLTMLQTQQSFKGSQPGTPVPTTRPINLQNNPTVSSVNTPTLMSNPLHTSFRQTPDSSGPGTPAELDENVVGPFGDLSMQGNPLMSGQSQLPRFPGNNDMVDLCIDEPAKRLFSPTGGPGQQNTHFKLGGAQYGPDSDIARRIREQQLLAGVPDTTNLLPNEEPKPFRCPVIGCEKAYKNQNGLKYHKAVSIRSSPCSPCISNFSSTVITISNYMTTQMERSPLSTRKPRLRIPEHWAWKRRSPTDARCAASDIRTLTDSNITSRILLLATPNCNWPRAAT